MSKFKISYEALETLADVVDSTDFRVDYSGRGMYGATCVGIVVEGEASLLQLGSAIRTLIMEGDLEDEVGEKMLNHPRFDSMGRGIIVYWPSVVYWTSVQVEGEDFENE